ncbi:MAG: polysaccharide pyruvyl transferase family protein [Ruminococcus sp.]|nr:polysaccharide pyruvyl transferase family protein [Ruminococcus sp.]
MKIGILTYCNAYNYGAYLQAYNLCTKLKTYDGIEAELIDLRMPQEEENYAVKIHKNLFVTYDKWAKDVSFKRAAKDLPLSPYSIRTADIGEFKRQVEGKYDLLIAGSDQIWQVKGFRGSYNAYFLPGDYGCPKVAYAASGRQPFDSVDEATKKKICEAINDFSYVGVRDIATYNNVKSVLEDKEKLAYNLDPSFLLQYVGDAERGREILKRHRVPLDKPVIGIMTENTETGKKLKSRLGSRYTYIGLFHRQKGCSNLLKITPFEWADVIACCCFMISSYFHGTCYSLINHIPFHTVEMRYSKEESKLYGLLSDFKITERFSGSLDEAMSSQDFWNQIETRDMDYTGISKIIEEYNEQFDSFVSMIKGLQK